MQRLKLIVAYDGSPFAGWQSQAHGNTVQDRLERAFAQITGGNVRVQGAGRTDAGVHALGQCAHVDLPKGAMAPAQWQSAINALLPDEIRVTRCLFISDHFHARFSATGKTYRYRIWNGDVLPPFERGRAWHVVAPIDLGHLRLAAAQLVGTHNFAAFTANRGTPPSSTTRTLHDVQVSRRGQLITLEFVGDGFLYKMVRLLVGAAVRCAIGRLPLESIAARLDGSAQTGPNAERFVAPAAGLILVQVRY